MQYIYFNTKGKKGGSPAIRELLDYLRKSTEENAKNETLKTLHRHIRKVKILPEVKEEYMLFEEKIYYERKEAAEEARIEQLLENITDLLEDYGEIPDTLLHRIEAEDDPDTLKRWHKLAARCGSLKAFEEQM